MTRNAIKARKSAITMLEEDMKEYGMEINVEKQKLDFDTENVKFMTKEEKI